MKKIYVLAILAAGALALSTSCKKDSSSDCISACGEEYCKSDYDADVKEYEEVSGGSKYPYTWSELKDMASKMDESDCEE